MEELDGIFQGDHVLGPCAVDEIQHGSQGGGFAAAGGTRDKDHPLTHSAESDDGLGQVQLFSR